MRRWNSISCLTLLSAALLSTALLQAQQAVVDTAKPQGITIPLWKAGAPGAKGTTAEDTPTLTAYLPTANPTKSAVVIAPGGGYAHLAIQKEGEDIARWLNTRGVAGFVLKYRLGPAYHHPIELQDGQRAIRLVRAHAAEYGVDPTHIGMWGFSAGGHLTATVGTQFDAGNSDATDEIDRQSSRPDFLVLAYPVITFMPPLAHTGSRTNLLGNNSDPALFEALSAETRVTKETPPAFLFTTTSDPVVPVLNSVLFYSALVKAGVPAELHIFQKGPHGVGLAPGFPQLKGWPDLLSKWMANNGWMAADAAAILTTP
jgi:acetyl esterase/lipase